MKYERIELNDYAWADAYILDPEISYGVTRTRPAMIVNPGGAFLMHATKEGEAVAMEYLNQGFNVFVFHYSVYFTERMVSIDQVPPVNRQACWPGPLKELFSLMESIGRNHEYWNIDPHQMYLTGFSAGGYLSLAAGCFWKDPSFGVDTASFTLKGIVAGYPPVSADLTEYILNTSSPDDLLYHQVPYVMDALFQSQNPTQEQKDALDLKQHVNADYPPVFIWNTVGDQVVDSSQTTEFVRTLQQYHCSVEYHLFESGPHGLGLATEAYAKSPAEVNDVTGMWVLLVRNWLKARISK